MVAVVNIDKCTGCGRCEIACPEEAIFVERKSKVVAGLCRACGSCTVVCEYGAIVLQERKEI